jgi:hypothetical protein
MSRTIVQWGLEGVKCEASHLAGSFGMRPPIPDHADEWAAKLTEIIGLVVPENTSALYL